MNNSDAERIETVLNGLGYKKTGKEKDADLIVAVACSVRQAAIDRIHGKVRNWQREKQKRKLVTVLTGCVLATDKKKFTESFDLVFNIENLTLLPEMLHSMKETDVRERGKYLTLKPMHSSGFQALVPIMTGCNNFCAYCAVPFTRGREYSRPAEDIISEVKELVENGCKEITLLGQNVNSYGNDKKDLPNFAELLSKINDIPGDFWIRYITSHPKDMSQDLIKKFVQCSKVCGYLHLPLQAGSSEVLKNIAGKFKDASLIMVDEESDLYNSSIFNFIKDEITGRKIMLIRKGDAAFLQGSSEDINETFLRVMHEGNEAPRLFLIDAENYFIIQQAIVKLRKIGYKFINPSLAVKEKLNLL